MKALRWLKWLFKSKEPIKEVKTLSLHHTIVPDSYRSHTFEEDKDKYYSHTIKTTNNGNSKEDGRS